MALLDPSIHSPHDLKPLSREQLRELAAEMRTFLIDSCSRTGGHIGAGLGVVELTIALHAVFEAPVDQILWDVGHQAYPHKLLTGRMSLFPTLRQEDGISGFLKRTESEYDAFGAGHAATAISAGLGMATARDLLGESFKVVSVLGDGALTCGLSYEGLNNAGASGRDFIVVLNDNEMSIAPNVGAISKYLTSVQRNPLYNRLRSAIGSAADNMPGPLHVVSTMVRKWEESVKAFLTPGVLFEELGFRYFGPIDGHDINALVDTFNAVRAMDGPRFVHVITQKGKGFPAGEHIEKWHALPPGHDPATGKQVKASTAKAAYTAVFGKGLTELAAIEPKLVTITAAMPSGTGTGTFAKAYPDRFFDVGIAEGHAVTFAAGMATRGIRPVCAIYSTFLQRGYDNVIHDVAIQQLPVVFAMDRAGLVGEDGPTHMGLYDIAYMLAVPGMTVTAPKDGTEMLALLRAAVRTRWPILLALSARHGTRYRAGDRRRSSRHRMGRGKCSGVVVTSRFSRSARWCSHRSPPPRRSRTEGLSVTVVNCRYLKPHDEVTLNALLADLKQFLVIEEGTVVNGFGAYISAIISRIEPTARVSAHGVPDRFMDQAPRARPLALVGLDAAGIMDRARALHDTAAEVVAR